MISTTSAILDNIVNGFSSLATTFGLDVIFFVALAVEAALVIFFVVKSIFSYEASLNRALEKINYWLFEKKVVTENNIKELNYLFKTKAPKRLCYYWQQYILFREGDPSTYLSTENLIDKPLKTSSYTSNIKNLTLLSSIWAFAVALFVIFGTVANVSAGSTVYLYVSTVVSAAVVPLFVGLIAIVFIIYLRFRRNSILNSLYQNISLFGRFMDNACVDLPSYIDYQILFTPQEIEHGQPVLREFLDYKARKEKEEFNKAKEESVNLESYDFSATGVDGSLILDRAMRESEIFMKKKEKILLKISQLESELDSRRKNFDNVQKDYQTKIQASKENVDRLRQMQEETTNRIESNYYRKQQTQEIGKQEQFEQEFEQQRAKYLLEKSEGEEEIAKLNAELESNKHNVEAAMMSEYQTFFDKFCHSAEKVVAKVFDDRLNYLQNDNDLKEQQITELQIKLKNTPHYDLEAEQDGQYDESGNFVFSNGTYYDKEGNFHAQNGDVYSQDGKLLQKAPKEEKPKEKQIVSFDDFDAFDFVTDISQKGDVYDVAENVVKDLDQNIDVVNSSKATTFVDSAEKANTQNTEIEPEPELKAEEKANVDALIDDFVLEDKPEAPKQDVQEKKETSKQNSAPKKKAGRPRKVQPETAPVKRKVGRPRKEKIEETPKRAVGRPRKIVRTEQPTVKKGRGRPRKDSIQEINKQLDAEQERIEKIRASINQDLENAMNDINSNQVDASKKQREKLIKEIERLQEEASKALTGNESESKIEEINNKLEHLLEEVKKLG